MLAIMETFRLDRNYCQLLVLKEYNLPCFSCLYNLVATAPTRIYALVWYFATSKLRLRYDELVSSVIFGLLICFNFFYSDVVCCDIQALFVQNPEGSSYFYDLFFRRDTEWSIAATEYVKRSILGRTTFNINMFLMFILLMMLNYSESVNDEIDRTEFRVMVLQSGYKHL